MRIMLAVLAALAFGVGSAATAQTFPDRPLRLVVAYPPGGATDVIGRLTAAALGEQLGQSVVVDNRGGGSGMVGAGSVARSDADGYTLIIATATTHAVNPTLYKKTITYDAMKDFTPIGFVGSTPLVLVTHPSVPANNLTELLAYLKKNGDKISYATGGSGSVPHMAGELFHQMAGIKVKPVHYRGDAPATTDVLGGHLPYIFAHLPVALPLIKSGQLRAIGVTTLERSSFAPEIPTLAEQGLAGYQIFTWWGIFGPAGIPPAIVAKLNSALKAGLGDPKAKERFFSSGYEVAPNSAAEFGAFAAAEYAKWGKIVVESGMQPE